MKGKYFSMSGTDLDEIEELKEIDKLLKEYKPYYTKYNKLLVIKNVKEGMSRGEAAELVNVHRKTAENWVKAYNKEGLASLETKYDNCGLNCRLSDEQLWELKNLIAEYPEKYSVEDIRKFIKDEFNVDYGYKQTWYILRRKLKLKFKNNKLIV